MSEKSSKDIVTAYFREIEGKAKFGLIIDGWTENGIHVLA